jgi:NAD(P)H-nitrite reductase large subunit
MTPDQPAVGVDQASDAASEDRRSEDAQLIIDADLIAPRLGLASDAFMAAIRRGIVYQRTERGIDDDIGRYRVTFLYRERRCRVIVSPEAGAVVQD